MFQLGEAEQKSFNSFDEMLAFAAEEKARIGRISLNGLWQKGARSPKYNF